MPWAKPKPYVEEETFRTENKVIGSDWIDTVGPIRWTCRLRIFFGDEKGNYARGSGFLVSLTPASTKDLIMTAGHNLVDNEGNYAKSIEVWFAGGKYTGSIGSETVTVTKDKNEYFASRSYENNPTESNAINDYGYILLKKLPDGQSRGGFSYSAIMEEKLILEKEATVFGYPAQLHDGSIITSDWALNAMGKITRIELDGRQLQYAISTEKGHSGGPVCVKNGDHYTAIGIHNYAGETEKIGNCGSILTCRNLFEMLERCYERASIELCLPKSKAGSSEILLKIPPGRRSRVIAQHGMDKYTEFNLIPVETYPVPTADSQKTAQTPKYVIAAIHRNPFIVLEFCKSSKQRPGMVVNSMEEDLINGRPTKRNLVELRNTSLPPRSSAKAKAWTINTVGTPRDTLRIPKAALDLKPGESECDCIESAEIPIVELVGELAPAKELQYNKFFVGGFI